MTSSKNVIEKSRKEVAKNINQGQLEEALLDIKNLSQVKRIAATMGCL